MLMVEFNPDGSIKLPSSLAKKNEEDKQRMQSERCITVYKDLVSTTAPKKCILQITLSNAISDTRFIPTIYNEFKESASVPSKIKQMDEKHFEVEIGTDFRRCSDCTSLLNKYREHLDQNLIEKKGNCTFQGRQQNFAYEDYFD